MKRNEMVTLSFQGEKPLGSHVQVDLTAQIEGPGGSKTVLGYYAGNGTYQVRFLPEQAGTYRYEVTGVVQASGELEIAEADEGIHGVLRAEGVYFRFQDGTYFHGFGTTVYALVHQTKELVEETMETLKNAPFNKVRLCVFPKDYRYNVNDPEYYPFEKNGESWDVHHPCFAFWDALEARLLQLGKMGIQADLILFHPYDRWGFATMPLADNLIYLDYLLRRLSAIPNLWWSLSNEYDLCFAKKAEDWEAFGRFIKEKDPYQHLLGNHNCFALYDHGKDYISHVSIQNRVMNRVPELQRKYQKPVCYDECCYEGNLNETWGNISGKEMTRRFWQVTVTGGHCTHGETFLDPKKAYDDDAVVWWSKGGHLIGESPKRIAFLRELVESFPGPLEYSMTGLTDFFMMSSEQLAEMVKHMEGGFRDFISSMQPMDAYEMTCHRISEFEYAGHVGDDIFLHYCDTCCYGRRMIPLPSENSYRIEAIDTWNMTRTVIATGARGQGPRSEFEVMMPMPASEGMAILCIKEDK